jgi:hypothetical protein
MPKLTEKQILARDAKRNLAEELAESLKELKAGKVGRVTVLNREGKLIEGCVSGQACRKPSSPHCLAYLCGRFSSGSKDVESLQVLPKPF